MYYTTINLLSFYNPTIILIAKETEQEVRDCVRNMKLQHMGEITVKKLTPYTVLKATGENPFGKCQLSPSQIGYVIDNYEFPGDSLHLE